MGKKRVPPIETLVADTQQFFDILNEKSDFAVIVVGASYLDAALAGQLAALRADR
jgi:hypothetical protein